MLHRSRGRRGLPLPEVQAAAAVPALHEDLSLHAIANQVAGDVGLTVDGNVVTRVDLQTWKKGAELGPHSIAGRDL